MEDKSLTLQWRWAGLCLVLAIFWAGMIKGGQVGATAGQMDIPKQTQSTQFQNTPHESGWQSSAILPGQVENPPAVHSAPPSGDPDWVHAYPRSGLALAYDSVRGVTVLFHESETWEWDGVNWVHRTSANHPPYRQYTAIAFDNLRGVIVLFGG